MIGFFGRVRHAFRLPIAVLVFRIPENDDEFSDACNGWKWHSLVQKLDESLRGRIKHGNERGSYQEARDLLYELLKDHGLEMWN